MKKITLFTLLFILATSINAKNQVSLTDKNGMPPCHNSCIPTVSTDGDDVVITCDSTLYNVDVIISDQYGNVMHQSTQTITPMESTIFVPDTGDGNEKASIDLYYDDKHLKGYFE